MSCLGIFVPQEELWDLLSYICIVAEQSHPAYVLLVTYTVRS
jgi:hypothetical protein